MSSTVLQFVLFGLAIVISALGYFVREALHEIRDIGRRIDKVHATVFGPAGDNGLYGDNLVTKRRLHRMAGFIQTVCVQLGMECDDDGLVTLLDGESPYGRRIAERAAPRPGRRATDPAS